MAPRLHKVILAHDNGQHIVGVFRLGKRPRFYSVSLHTLARVCRVLRCTRFVFFGQERFPNGATMEIVAR